MVEDREGYLWFGAFDGGVSRCDPAVKDSEPTGSTRPGEGLVSSANLRGNNVWCMLEDGEGNLWFGTEGGVHCRGPVANSARSDSSEGTSSDFVPFTEADGLTLGGVRCILEDREGHLWFGSWEEGVSRHDPAAARSVGPGEMRAASVSFAEVDGLARDRVTCASEDRKGHLWFGTYGRGVRLYDGLVFQNLLRRDGLAHNTVQDVFQDRDGDIWIATEGGVTRYRPRRAPPRIRITDVVADRRCGPVDEIRLPASQKHLGFEFQGTSLTTRPEGMAYVVRLDGRYPEWRPLYAGRADYEDLPLGEYTFQVKAVDRDLNYSEPEAVRIIVEPDPRLEGFAEALRGTSDEFVGSSEALRRVQMQLSEVAPTDVTVLILGETGTGKGLAARTVHGLSTRGTGPFIPVNCGAIPEGLVESELFGHERGAFTGAVSRKLGRIELAEEGTLFLDEIGDLAPAAQTKLLRFLEERTFERVGGTEMRSADVRIIAATNRDVRGMVEEGTFREDLYFRLQVFPIKLPPLRERREDIPVLASCFMERMAQHLDKDVTHLTPDALAALHAYDWPGNIRELEHAVERAVIVCRGAAIRAPEIALELGETEKGSTETPATLEEVERRYVREVLESTGWVIKGPHGAAIILGLPVSTLRSRMKKLGIVRP